ncbi:MAG: alpha/beta fold hydrolase [Calditrichaeota bacterium]|nr:MAG: alpha/beta fold hydrolase [Calditrichota bacterium]
MPLIQNSTYNPPRFFSNGHLQTVYQTLFRKVEGVKYQRERIETPDGDFLDLDWSLVDSEKLVILIHGLEGSSNAVYIKAMVKILNKNGFDTVSMNMRGCSGASNKLLRAYHSGATEDLETVVSHILKTKPQKKIGIVGFSLGGNLTLKYLGEQGEKVAPKICGAVTFSVPCDLLGSSFELKKPKCKMYTKRFLIRLGRKMKIKSEQFPNKIDFEKVKTLKNLSQFDDFFTAPVHGFKDAEDYYKKCSSKQFLPKIQIPTLLVNADNDPFLSQSCFPIEEAKANKNFSLEITDSGGHVGFVSFSENEFWYEKRAVEFLNSVIVN